MPTDFSFINKLRMDNLYPTVPTKKIRGYPLYERFLQDLGPAEIQQQQQPPGQMHNMTKPMDVVFDQGNISEAARGIAAAKTIHGVDLNRNAMSPYQQGQLQNRDRQLDIQEQNYMGNRNLAQQRVQETREMNDFKMKNPGGEFVKQPDGNILYVGPGGQTLGNFGPSGIMAEERKIGMNQQNAVQLADRRGEIQGALEDKAQYGRSALQTQRDLGSMARTQATIGGRPIGTTRDVAYKYDDKGTVIGASSTTKQVMPPPPQSIRGNAAMMYGPDGKQYPVPIENTDEAQEKYGMTFTPVQSRIGKNIKSK